MNGWTNCGCGTTYTDAYGNPINVDSQGATGSVCSPNWGLLACAAVAAFVAIGMSGKKKA